MLGNGYTAVHFLLGPNICFSSKSKEMDQESSGLNIDMGHDHFDFLDDPWAGSSAVCLEDLADAEKRRVFNWRKVEPLFSFLYVSGSWAVLHREEHLLCDML